MKTEVIVFSLSLFLIACSSEKKDDGKSESSTETDTMEKPDDTNVISQNPNLAFAFNKNQMPYPRIIEYQPEFIGSIKNSMTRKHLHFITITYTDGTVEEIPFEPENLIARIGNTASRNNYHKKLAVYLFEKQWHSVRLKYVPKKDGITYFEVINPPYTKNWILNAVQESENGPIILASYSIPMHEAGYERIFQEVNGEKFSDFKKYIYEAPNSEKIDYNNLRKLGKFHEGIAAPLNNVKYIPNELYKDLLALAKNKPENCQYFYDNEFTVPEMGSNGAYSLDGKEKKQSLKELYHVKSFAYKSAYPLTGEKDSTLEMQIDFKTKENQATIRFVIGGIVFSEIPRLKNDEMNKGLYLPLGFGTYKNKAIKQESYVFMGNTSGLWTDNTYGKNIDGVLLYFDKTSKSKIHIWLMGGDGFLPVGHYVATLDALFR